MATVTVKLFGPQAQLAKQRELAIAVDASNLTAAQLLSTIAATCPALADSIVGSKLAVNHEVALIGMLGGG